MYKKQPLALEEDDLHAQQCPFPRSWLHSGSVNQICVKEARLMLWPACSPDLNPIENFWSMLKRKIYEEGKQYSSKNCLWEAIQSCAAAVDKGTIKTLTVQ